jgi:hypothetical protein
MWQDRKRLILMLAMVPVLAVAYLLLHGLPGSRAGAGPADPPPAEGKAPAQAPDAEARKGPDRSVPPAIQDKYADDYRRIAAIALRPKVQDIAALKAGLSHPSPGVGLQAVRGLGRLGLQGDPAALLAVLADKTGTIDKRSEAADHLGQMRCWEAGPTLIDVLEESSLPLRTRASVALRKIMIVSFDYQATDPPDRRQKAAQFLREWWPKAYKKHLELQGQ